MDSSPRPRVTAVTVVVIAAAGAAAITVSLMMVPTVEARDGVAEARDGVTAYPSNVAQPDEVGDYQVNASGQTYGSIAGVSEVDAPDLILVEMQSGGSGYVRAEELFEAEGGNVSSPEEAVAWQQERDAAGPVPVDVYDVEGTSIIGTFYVGE